MAAMWSSDACLGLTCINDKQVNLRASAIAPRGPATQTKRPHGRLSSDHANPMRSTRVCTLKEGAQQRKRLGKRRPT